MGHQCPPDGEHLLFAAAEEAGNLVLALAQARKIAVDKLKILLERGPLLDVRPGAQVLRDRQVLENTPPFHHLKDAHADNRGGILFMDGLVEEAHFAVGDGTVFGFE